MARKKTRKGARKVNLIRIEGGRLITEKEWNARVKLAKKQTKLLQKSAREHDKITKEGVEAMKQGKSTKRLIAKERAWAKKDTALRTRLQKEFARKFPRR